jgi:hypothetical protein
MGDLRSGRTCGDDCRRGRGARWRVRALGVIPNRAEAIRRLVKRLGPVQTVHACYEAGPCGYVLYGQLTGRRYSTCFSRGGG